MATESNGKVKKLVFEAEPRVSSPDGIENEDFIVVTPGSCKKCTKRYEVTMTVPNVSKTETVAELSEQVWALRGLKLQDLVNTAFRALSTRVQFDACFDKEAVPERTVDPTGGDDYKDYPFKQGESQRTLQAAIDAYRPGQKTSSSEAKAAKRLLGVVRNAGLDDQSDEDMRELENLLARMKAKKAAAAAAAAAADTTTATMAA